MVTDDAIDSALHAYAREVILARRRRAVDRDELHPGDVGLGTAGDIRVLMGLMNREAMRAALEAVH